MQVILEDTDGNEISSLDGLPKPIHHLVAELYFMTESNHRTSDNRYNRVIESCFDLCQMKLEKEKSEYSVEQALAWDTVKIVVSFKSKEN